jgi:hypothetical protein
MTSDNGFILGIMSYLEFQDTKQKLQGRPWLLDSKTQWNWFEWDKTVVIVLTKPNLSYKPKMEVMLPLAGHSRICQEIKQKVEGKILGC